MDTTLNVEAVLELDSWLKPFLPYIAMRHSAFRRAKEAIQKSEGGYDAFTKGYLKFGFNVSPSGEVTYREWAPNAKEAALIGEFSESVLLFFF